MRKLLIAVPFLLCVLFASIYIYPVFTGLILLPLDLLVSNSNPWRLTGEILLKNPYMQDSIVQMYPWRHMSLESLSHGILPLWNPYQFAGMPFMASMKPLVFHPTNVFYFLGAVRSWNLHLWLQLFGSAWFMYLLCRSLRLSHVSSMLASITFAANSLMVGVLQFGSEGHVILWFPFYLYCIRRFFDTGRRIWLPALAIGIAVSLFAGHIQYFAYGMILLSAFTIWEIRTRKLPARDSIPVFLGIAIGIGLGGIQLLPGAELYSLSYRGLGGSYDTFSTGLMKPYSLLRLLSPDWFGNPVTNDLHGGYIETSGYFGILALFFTIYSLVKFRTLGYVRFFAGVFLVSVLLSMDGLAQILYHIRIPVITGGFGSRIYILALLSGSVLAGFGLDAFLQHSAKRSQAKWILAYSGIVFLLFGIGLLAVKFDTPFFVRFSNIKIQVACIILFSAGSVVFAAVRKRYPIPLILFAVLVVFLTFGDLFRMGYRFLTFSNPKFLYPEVPVVTEIKTRTRDSLGRVYGITEPEMNGVFRIPGLETYNPLYPLRTARVFQAFEGRSHEKLPTNKYYLGSGNRMKYLLDAMGTTIIVASSGRNPASEYWQDKSFESDIEKIYSDVKHDVYINKTAYPRISVFYDVRTGVTDEQALGWIEERSVDLRKTLLIREDAAGLSSTGSATIGNVRYEMNGVSLDVHTTASGYLYISDANFPGWTATVNSRATPVYTANYAFRAVSVPKGFSKVTMEYSPRSLVIGGWISSISVVFLLLLGFYPARGSGNSIQGVGSKAGKRT